MSGFVLATCRCMFLVLLTTMTLSLSQAESEPAGSCDLEVTATANSSQPQQQDSKFQPCPFPDFEGAITRFGRILSFKTVSSRAADNAILYPEEFEQMDKYLSQAYSKVWDKLQVEKLGKGGHSYLLTWQGSQPDLRPALFISHLDVVPVTAGTEQDWMYPPFSGQVAEGYIWGRGALDVKVGVVGLLEGAMALINEGYEPKRTLIMAFGQDEESSGFAGAAQIAGKLAAEGTQLEFIWDEGGTIYADGLPPLTRMPVALVATAEKLFQEVRVTLHSPGGHSSMPPIDGSSIGARLGSFLAALTGSPPAPRLESPTQEFLQGLLQLPGSWLSPLAILIKNSNLAGQAVPSLMARAAAPMAALVRDTAAMTKLQAGVAANVLPQTAEVSINFRLLPSTIIPITLEYVQGWLGANAAHANVTLGVSAFASSKVADSTGPAFKLITQAIQEGWKFSKAAGAKLEGTGVPVLPYLMPGGTDSKHYQNLTDTILRFCPFSVTPEDLATVHGTNEKIHVTDYGRALCTYRAGLRLAGDWVPAT